MSPLIGMKKRWRRGVYSMLHNLPLCPLRPSWLLRPGLETQTQSNPSCRLLCWQCWKSDCSDGDSEFLAAFSENWKLLVNLILVCVGSLVAFFWRINFFWNWKLSQDLLVAWQQLSKVGQKKNCAVETLPKHWFPVDYINWWKNSRKFGPVLKRFW